MTLLFCIATGLIVGGLLAFVTASDGTALILDLTAGISGAVLGGWLLGPVFEAAPAAVRLFDEGDVFCAVGGALMLLAVTHLLQARDRAG